MTLNKLKKLITIWLNEVINGKLRIWQVGSGKSGENKFYRTYDISSDDDSWRGKSVRLYINTYEDINKNVKQNVIIMKYLQCIWMVEHIGLVMVVTRVM